MKDRRKRNIMIGSLCALLVFMGIGYAIISQMLTIRGVSTVAGDWNIYIDSITPNAIGTGVSVNESVGIDKISANFEANLYAPGDKVVVKNDGNIDAKLGAVNQHVTNDTDNIVKYSNTLENGYILRHGESYVFYVTTEIPEEKEELPSENTVHAVLDLKLNFTQYTGSGSGGNEDPDRTIIAQGDLSKTDSDNVEWKYYSDGALEISGNGDMLDYPHSIYESIDNEEDARVLPIYQQIISQVLYKNDPTKNSYANMFQLSGGEYDLADEYMPVGACLYSNLFFENFISEQVGTEINNMDDYLSLLLSYGSIDNETDAFLRNSCSLIPQITSIVFTEGSNITSIGQSNFTLLGYGGELSIPNTVTSIGDYAFEVNSITSINFNNTTNLREIGTSAFRSNGITNLVLPQSLNELGYDSFELNKLTSLTLNGTYTNSSLLEAFTCNPDLNNSSITINATLNGSPINVTDLQDIDYCAD